MKNSIVYTPNTPADIVSLMTTRRGGFSTGNISEFSFGLNTVDTTKNVLKNYKYLEAKTGLEKLTILYQVHSNIVLEATKDNYGDIYMNEADGLFTAEKNLAIGVLTADCYPVHLWGDKCIAVLHCGWRSANSNIIENAKELFEQHNDKITNAHIGTGICQDCYEIKDDMYKQLNKGYNPDSCVTKTINGSYQFDLKRFITNALKHCSISDITTDKTCSSCSEGYYSYRRDDGVTGRMISVIMRKD